MTVQQMIAQHVETWDMPTLVEQAPEVVEHLMSKYDVVFPEDFTGQVYVQHKDTFRLEKMGTTDVREAVVKLLVREALAEEVAA